MKTWKVITVIGAFGIYSLKIFDTPLVPIIAVIILVPILLRGEKK